MQKSIVFQADVVACSAHVPVHHVGQNGIKLILKKIVVAGGRAIGAGRFEEPQRGIGGVVFGRGRFVFILGDARFDETVGQHPLADVPGEMTQNLLGHVVFARAQGEAWKRNHGVASPVGEPGIARHDGVVFIVLAGLTVHGQELVGGRGERPQE